MKSVKLNQFATVTMGQSFRSRLERVDEGNVFVIQMKDLTDDNRFNASSLIRIQLNTPKKHHLVEQGDIAFRSRGQTNTAVVIDHIVGASVIAAPLLRIRVDSGEVLPEYLCWYINHPKAQAWLASHAKGTAVQMISKRSLEELEVVIPPIEQQRKIVLLAALTLDEQRLMKDLAEKRRQYMDRILMQIASGAQ